MKNRKLVALLGLSALCVFMSSCSADLSRGQAKEQIVKNNNLPLAAAEAAIIAARETKVSEDNAKRLRRHCMSKNEMDAFLWVKKSLFKRLIKNGEGDTPARARTEIATAKAFGLEPLNWAKRDIVVFVEKERIWEKKRDEVEQRLKAAQDYSAQVDRDMMHADPKWDPGKYAGLYWFASQRKANPNNPYSIAIEKERTIEREREQLYHRFKKETPEEKLGGGLAILLTLEMMRAAGETALAEALSSGGGEIEAEAKQDSMEKADTNLGITEKAKIDRYDQFEASQDDVLKFLAEDLRLAIDYATQYRAFVATGEIIPTHGGDKVMRKGCECK